MKVDVYKNLHNGKWSVLDRKTRRLHQHANRFVVRGATFVVQPAGRQRVIDEGRKNVHAFVRGEYYGAPHFLELDKADFPVRVSYNPKDADHFIRTDTGEKVTKSASLNGLVLLDKDGAWMQSEPCMYKINRSVSYAMPDEGYAMADEGEVNNA